MALKRINKVSFNPTVGQSAHWTCVGITRFGPWPSLQLQRRTSRRRSFSLDSHNHGSSRQSLSGWRFLLKHTFSCGLSIQGLLPFHHRLCLSLSLCVCVCLCFCRPLSLSLSCSFSISGSFCFSSLPSLPSSLSFSLSLSLSVRDWHYCMLTEVFSRRRLRTEWVA